MIVTPPPHPGSTPTKASSISLNIRLLCWAPVTMFHDDCLIFRCCGAKTKCVRQYYAGENNKFSWTRLLDLYAAECFSFLPVQTDLSLKSFSLSPNVTPQQHFFWYYSHSVHRKALKALAIFFIHIGVTLEAAQVVDFQCACCEFFPVILFCSPSKLLSPTKKSSQPLLHYLLSLCQVEVGGRPTRACDH